MYFIRIAIGLILFVSAGTRSFSSCSPMALSIDITDSLIFDLSQAQCSSGTLEFPIYISSDENIYSIDFSLKFNPSTLTFNSITDIQPYMNSSAYFNTADSTLRFSSFSLQPIDDLVNLALVKFNLPSSQINHAQFDSVYTLLNGDNCGHLIIDPQLPIALNINVSPVIYPGDSVLLSVEPNPMFSYNWSTGETGNSIYVFSPGIYSVTVGVLQGCISQVSVVLNAPSPLPVELLFFKANPNKNSMLLNWSTASETNSDYFEIQRTDQSFLWSGIGDVKACGNSNSIKQYSFSDHEVKEGVNYYRLKQVDYDGSFYYSEVIKGVFNSRRDEMQLIALPNPIVFSNNPVISFQNPEIKGCGKIELIQPDGRRLFSERISDFSSFNNSIDLSNNGSSILKPGLYILVVSGDQKAASCKLLVQ